MEPQVEQAQIFADQAAGRRYGEFMPNSLIGLPKRTMEIISETLEETTRGIFRDFDGVAHYLLMFHLERYLLKRNKGWQKIKEKMVHSGINNNNGADIMFVKEFMDFSGIKITIVTDIPGKPKIVWELHLNKHPEVVCGDERTYLEPLEESYPTPENMVLNMLCPHMLRGEDNADASDMHASDGEISDSEAESAEPHCATDESPQSEHNGVVEDDMEQFYSSDGFQHVIINNMNFAMGQHYSRGKRIRQPEIGLMMLRMIEQELARAIQDCENYVPEAPAATST